MSDTSKKQERDEHGRLLPGNTANPNGRPKKGYSITEAFRTMLSAEPEVKAQIVQSIKDKALAGDPAAIKMVWEYMDGKPKQPVVGGDEDDAPIEHKVIVEFVRPPNAD